MRSRARALALGLISAVLVSILPASTAFAADVATTTELHTVPSPVFVDDTIHVGATVTPIPPAGNVTWEWSDDDATWHVFKTDAVFAGDGTSGGFVALDLMIPPGTVQVRAHFQGTAGYQPSISSTRSMTVNRHASSFSSFTVSSGYSAILPGSTPITLDAAIGGTGNVRFDRKVGSDWEELGTSALSSGHATWQTTALGAGTSTFRASFLGNSLQEPSETETSVTPTKGGVTLSMSDPGFVLAGQGFSVVVGMSASAANSVGPSGDLSLKIGATVIGTAAPGGTINVPGRPAGDVTLTVAYPGDANYDAATQDWQISIFADTVEATGVGVSSTSVYPYKDGYKDSVAIRGNRQEAISVAVRIYSPLNKLVRSASYALATGPYSFAWNGRTSSGATLAAGKYKVVQTLKDGAGTTRAFTRYVTISSKRLVTKTVYVTKKGTAMTAKGDPGNGSISLSSTGVATLKAGSYPSGWVGAGYAFTLPSATVYKSLAFQIYSKGVRSVPPNVFGVQNFVTCPYSSTGAWNEACFDHLANAAGTSTALSWKSTAASVTTNRYGRTVRGMVSVNVGTVYVYQVRVKVVYGVLV